MKISYVSRPDGATRLILLFAGWAMDERPFSSLSFGDYDIALVCDYRSTALDADFSRYEEIVVMAWSFGVVGAEIFLSANPRLPVTATIAVNGTPEAVDDSLGIPEALFDATLAALTPASLSKFYRRVAGRRHREFVSAVPQRDFSGLADELRAVRALRGRRGVKWDKALISGNDRIIPPGNQRESWAKTSTEIIEDPSLDHLPDFAAIFRRHLSVKPLVATRFAQSRDTYDAAADVQCHIARVMAGKLPDRVDGPAVEIGCGTGISTRMLLERHPALTVRAVDIHPCTPITGLAAEVADGEIWLSSLGDESVGLVYSVSAVQWFNSLPRFLRECVRVLRPGGSLVFSTFGPLTMRQLRDAGIATRHYSSPEAIAAMFPPDMCDIRIESELLTPLFNSPREVLEHLRATGVNAVASASPTADALAIMRRYPLDPDGAAPLTYQPVYITARKKQ